MHLKVTYINDESLASTFFLYRHETLEAEKSQGAALFLFVLGTVSRSYEAKKILLPCIYRYAFSFTLKLRTTLLQKLAAFYTWNVTQKDNGKDQNTLHYYYGDYVTMSQQD